MEKGGRGALSLVPSPADSKPPRAGNIDCRIGSQRLFDQKELRIKNIKLCISVTKTEVNGSREEGKSGETLSLVPSPTDLMRLQLATLIAG